MIGKKFIQPSRFKIEKDPLKILVKNSEFDGPIKTVETALL